MKSIKLNYIINKIYLFILIDINKRKFKSYFILFKF